MDPTLEAFPLPEDSGYHYAHGFTSQHRGIDIFAPRGTPLLAVRDGNARSSIEPKGGKVAYLTAEDGTVFFYGHLDQWELPLLRPEGVRVLAGDQIGTVGTSGNAAGKPAHVHLQMRMGSLVVDPLPHLVAVDPSPNRPRVPDPPPGLFGQLSSFGAGASSGALLALAALWYFGSKRR